MKTSTPTKWTCFMDMHSGGGLKEKWSRIFIEAPEAEAKIIFQNRFGHNPERVTCTCCGEDYSIGESDTLEQATGYHRGCAYAYFTPEGVEIPEKEAFIPGKGCVNGAVGRYVERPEVKSYSKDYQTIGQYATTADVLIIHADEIKDSERTGELKGQGYVWVD